MIDTIKLTLSKDMYWITDRSKFIKKLQNATRGYCVYVQNPTKAELKNGIYKPRLTLQNRFNTTGRSEETLSIELSLPKLIYGNNFNELTNDYFDEVIDRLVKVLSEMGVKIFSEVLRNAPVSAVHYSKNIILTNGLTPHFLIAKIKQANLPIYLHPNEKEYLGSGYGYKWHCNSYEIAFYDKLKDLQYSKVSEKLSEEADNDLQLNLFDQLKARFEVLRMEIRLNSRAVIKRTLQTIKVSSDLRFNKLFNLEIAQHVLLYYLVKIQTSRPALLDYSKNDQRMMFIELIKNNPRLGVVKSLQMLGLKTATDSIDLSELRNLFSKYPKRYWYRLMNQLKSIKVPNNPTPLKIIYDQVVNYVPLNLVDFQKEMLNNDKYI